MRMNKDVSIALNLISMVNATPRTVASLAAEMGESVLFLQQIVRKLRQHGIISVTRGPGGGITRPDEYGSISLLAVYGALGKAPKAGKVLSLNSDVVNKALLAYLSNTQIPYGRLAYV